MGTVFEFVQVFGIFGKKGIASGARGSIAVEIWIN
jgi:hypothetical protein